MVLLVAIGLGDMRSGEQRSFPSSFGTGVSGTVARRLGRRATSYVGVECMCRIQNDLYISRFRNFHLAR